MVQTVDLTTTQALGSYGEKLASDMLRSAGYTVVLPAERKCGDLEAITWDGEIIRVEVKTARRGKGGWQFCLRRGRGGSKTDISHADFVLLLAAGKVAWDVFVIPTGHIASGQKIIKIKHPYEGAKGKWARYLVRSGKINLEVKS